MRSLIFHTLRLMGLLQYIRKISKNSVAILKIHGVMSEEVPSVWTPLRPQISPQRLEVSLKALSKYYRFIRLEDAVDMLSGRLPFKSNCIVLTFDDGYRNQVKYTLPVLSKFNAPATVFLATGNIDRRRPFWFDRLDYALQHARLAGREFKIGNEIIRFSSESRDDVRISYKQLRDCAKRASRSDNEMVSELEALAERLEGESRSRLSDILEEDDWSAPLTWTEIKKAEEHGLLTFGAHTVDHVRIGLVGESEIRYQVGHSKSVIEKYTEKECRYFCYPSGSFNDASIKVLKECSYKGAVTSVEGTNELGENMFALKRISLPGSGGASELFWQMFQFSRIKKFFVRGFRTIML